MAWPEETTAEGWLTGTLTTADGISLGPEIDVGDLTGVDAWMARVDKFEYELNRKEADARWEQYEREEEEFSRSGTRWLIAGAVLAAVVVTGGAAAAGLGLGAAGTTVGRGLPQKPPGSWPPQKPPGSWPPQEPPGA